MASNQPTNLKDRLIKGNAAGEETKFRSLKYEPSRGFNDQPFIRTELPGVEEDNPNIGLLGNGDFLLRAGSLERSGQDVARLTKFFSTPQGLGFIAKQNLLSRINVKPQGGGLLNQGPYLPTNTLAQAGVSALGGSLVKQGTNPFRDLNPTASPIEGTDDGSFLSKAANFVTKGVKTINNNANFPLYLENVTTDQSEKDNRLAQLKNSKISLPVNIDTQEGTGLGRLLGTVGSLLGNKKAQTVIGKIEALRSQVPTDLSNLNISPSATEILRYQGGPNAYLGVGATSIKRYSDTTSYNTEQFRQKYYLLSAGEIQARADQAVENPGVILEDFRKDLLAQQDSGQKKDILTDSPSYKEKAFETRVGLGDPGTAQKDLKSYTLGSGLGPIDKVNALPLYESAGVTANPVKNDFVKFRFAVPDTDNPAKKTYIHFRALIDGMNDNYSSNWSEQNYMGRTDTLYRFGGFTRSVVMSFKVVAQSREELLVMYTKLNYLQSIMTGDYTEKGYMAGNFVNITVGGYFWETPSVVTSMNINIPDQSPWEIGIADTSANEGTRSGQTIKTDTNISEMPHIIEVTGFSFNPIHEFAPRKQKNIFNKGGTLTEFGKQRFISLRADSKDDSAYDKKDGRVRPQFQFNPGGLVDSSKTLNSVEGQAGLDNSPQAMPSSEISKKLQGLKG